MFCHCALGFALQVLSNRPRIIYYPNFLSEDEINDILAKGVPMLKPSRTDAGMLHGVVSILHVTCL